MNCKCLIPYIDYNDENSFVYKDEEFDKNYVNILYDEYNKYKDSIDLITRKSLNGDLSMSSYISDKKKESEKKINYKYFEIDSIITDIYENEDIMDMLISHFQKKDMFPLIIKFKELNKNPDFNEELKMWVRENDNITKSKKLSENEKIIFAPKKNLKIITDKNSKAILEDCKILELLSPNEIAIIINKIIFVK